MYPPRINLIGRTILVLLFFIPWLTVSFPKLSSSHSPGEHKHDLENIPAKPEGMIEFDGGQTPGSEYTQDEPAMPEMDHAMPEMDHAMPEMDHAMPEMDHAMPGKGAEPFRTRGAHDLMGEDRGRAQLSPGKSAVSPRQSYLYAYVRLLPWLGR